MVTARREALDHLLIADRRHLEAVLTEFIEHLHEARPHQGINQRRPNDRQMLSPVRPAGSSGGNGSVG